jgi:hypothetical protein
LLSSLVLCYLSFGRPGHRYEDNIKMYLTETGWEVVDWMLLAQDRDR